MSVRREPFLLTYEDNAPIPTVAPVKGDLVAGQVQVGRFLESLFVRLNSGTSGTFQPVGYSEEAEAWLVLCDAQAMETGDGFELPISVQEENQVIAFIVTEKTGEDDLVLHVQPKVSGA